MYRLMNFAQSTARGIKVARKPRKTEEEKAAAKVSGIYLYKLA
jgi:preprotein translocase subunit Sss1